MDSILKIDEKYKIDESIVSYEYYNFYPITGSQLNNPGAITITVQNGDNFYHPSQSYLEFEGVLKHTNGAYTQDQLITFANNGILFLFDSMRYELSSTEIESVFNLGHCTNILGLARFSSQYNKTVGLNQCWSMDTSDTPDDTNLGFKKRRAYVINGPTSKGTFRFAVRLDHIFGFAECYNSVIYGFTHSLTLIRSSTNNNALFRRVDTPAHVDLNVPDGIIDLKNITWKLPRVTPADVAKYELLKKIQGEIVLDVGFRMRQSISCSVKPTNQFTWRLGVRSSPERPRFIFLAFQNSRDGNQQRNSAVYDHCSLTNAFVLLNNDKFPLTDMNADFSENKYTNVYFDFMNFMQRYYQIDPLVATTAVDTLTYKSLYPIIFFDVSKQSESLKTGMVDITIQCYFKNNVDAGTVAHAVIISDRKLTFKSDGSKMNVIF